MVGDSGASSSRSLGLMFPPCLYLGRNKSGSRPICQRAKETPPVRPCRLAGQPNAASAAVLMAGDVAAGVEWESGPGARG
eukprot:754494-Hanusia_phi.AAC.4